MENSTHKVGTSQVNNTKQTKELKEEKKSGKDMRE